MSGTWGTGWATGDVVTAAEYTKGAGAVFDSTLSSAAASFDITSINGSYAHLLLTLYLRGDTAAATTTALLRFNADTAANYDYQRLSGSAATASAVETFAATSIQIASVIPANTAGANLFAQIDVWIPHYAGSANNKDVVASFAHKQGTATGNLTVGDVAGFWRSNSAITQITVLPGAGNFAAGSRATLHVFGA